MARSCRQQVSAESKEELCNNGPPEWGQGGEVVSLLVLLTCKEGWVIPNQTS